jgi:predicted secreted Zn-dependent protease
MMKKCHIVLLLASLSLPVFAGERGLDTANFDIARQVPIKGSYLSPRIVEKYQYYDIRGNSQQELTCELQDNGCTTDGKKYDSITRWRISWDYAYNLTAQGCVADSFRTTVEINYRFPRWVQTDAAPPLLVESWDTYLKNLQLHEQGHRDIAVTAAGELSQTVADLPPYPLCSDLDLSIRRIFRGRTEKLNADSKAYDTATNHGASQGALFP